MRLQAKLLNAVILHDSAGVAKRDRQGAAAELKVIGRTGPGRLGRTNQAECYAGKQLTRILHCL
jgi:hypothetical protein